MMVAINLWVKYFPDGLTYVRVFTRYLVQKNPRLLHTAYNISQFTHYDGNWRCRWCSTHTNSSTTILRCILHLPN